MAIVFSPVAFVLGPLLPPVGLESLAGSDRRLVDHIVSAAGWRRTHIQIKDIELAPDLPMAGYRMTVLEVRGILGIRERVTLWSDSGGFARYVSHRVSGFFGIPGGRTRYYICGQCDEPIEYEEMIVHARPPSSAGR